MNQLASALLVCLALTLPLANARASLPDVDADPDNNEQYETDDADEIADQVTQQMSGPQLMQKPAEQEPAAAPAPASASLPTEADVKVDATNAKQAAKVARRAAKVANKVAKHSVKVTGHAKKALKHALGALHDARVDSSHLNTNQKESLKMAEAHLREATKTAEYGELKKVKDAKDFQKDKMETDLQKRKKSKAGLSERKQMRQEIQELRKTLKEKCVDDDDINKALDDLEAELDKTNGPIDDESKAELERLRQLVNSLGTQCDTDTKTKKEPQVQNEPKELKAKPLEVETDANTTDTKPREADTKPREAEPVPVPEKGFDIDTEMPYGDLEPFGREDTAQELTEASIAQSDAMVDQLERAEVSEEKRAVFRALTRLRGAAITSFDGVARSQTGNIDEYNKLQKWRSTHPLHHLADEESDVSKWAFPDNAD